MATGSATYNVEQGVGAEAIIDAVVMNTPVFVRWSQPPTGTLDGSLVLNNIELTNVPTAVGITNGQVLVSIRIRDVQNDNHIEYSQLSGGTTTIDSWAMGDTYSGTDTVGTYTQGGIASIQKSSNLLDSAGRIFGKSHPQYTEYSPDQFVSVKAQGAAGDGKTDDTDAINDVFAQVGPVITISLTYWLNNPLVQYAGCKIIFFDAGTYIVTSTITIPAGTQVVGEAWTTIMGSGSAFEDYNNPQVVVRVGEPGSTGVVEITDMIFTAKGPGDRLPFHEPVQRY